MIQKKRLFIGSFLWPFTNYDVLMPKQMNSDLFEWLFLTLVLHNNEEQSLKKNSYTEKVKIEVKRVIKEKFSKIIDEVLLSNIVDNAEKDFVKVDINGIDKIIDEKVFTFVETYQELFSESLNVQKVLVDSLTGDVVPCFMDLDKIEEEKGSKELRRFEMLKNIEKPSKDKIKKALLIFNQNKKNQNTAKTEDFDFFDKDAESDFNPQFNDDFKSLIEKKVEMEENFNVLFIENTKYIINVKFDVYEEDNKIVVVGPFDYKTTYVWFNKQIKLAKTSDRCPDVSAFFSEIENNYLVKEDQKRALHPTIPYIKSLADQFQYFGKIYKLIEHLDNNDLKDIVITLDKLFDSRSEFYFTKFGNFLEALLSPLESKNKASRKGVEKSMYDLQLDFVSQNVNLNVRPLMSKNIYSSWEKGFVHFKADIADIVMTNGKLFKSTNLYESWVQDMCDLYDLRQDSSHYRPGNKNIFDKKTDLENIEKLFEATKVVIDLY